MGCCIIKNSIQAKGSIQTIIKSKDLASQRQDLTSIIFSLHKIILSCNIQIESYLIKKEKNWASILKCKKFCIQAKQKELQALASKMDSYLEDSKSFKNEKKEIQNFFEQISQEINSMTVFDAEVNIDTKCSSYLEKLNNDFKNLEIDFHRFESEVELDLRSMTNKVIQEGTIRRKYFKSRKSV